MDKPPEYPIPQPAPLVCEVGYTPPEEKEEYKTSNHTVIKQHKSDLGYNCWDYAKSKAKLPQGLWTLNDKLNKIKSHEPQVGSVGVTKEGRSGHLVIIEEVGENYLVISEGNYRHGYITWRKIHKETVVGYL